MPPHRSKGSALLRRAARTQQTSGTAMNVSERRRIRTGRHRRRSTLVLLTTQVTTQEPIQQSGELEQSLGESIEEPQMESKSMSGEWGTDEEPESITHSGIQMQTSDNDALHTTHYRGQNHGTQGTTESMVSSQAPTQGNARQRATTSSQANLPKIGLQRQFNSHSAAPSQYMTTGSGNPLALGGRGLFNPTSYMRQNVQEQVQTVAQHEAIISRLHGIPVNTTQEEQVLDDISPEGVSPKDLRSLSGDLWNDLSTLRPCVRSRSSSGALVKSAGPCSSSLGHSLNTNSITISGPSVIEPSTESDSDSTYEGVDSPNPEAMLDSAIEERERLYVGEFGAHIPTTKARGPSTKSIRRGGGGGGQGNGARGRSWGRRGGISRRPSPEKPRLTTPTAIAKLVDNLLSRDGSSTIASTDYFSRPSVGISTATTPGVDGGGITSLSSCSRRHQSFHQYRGGLVLPTRSPLLPMTMNSAETQQSRNTSSSQAPNDKAKGKVRNLNDVEGAGVKSSGFTTVPSQGSAIPPPIGYGQYQGRMGGLSNLPYHSTLSFLGKENTASSFPPQAAYIETIDGITGARSYDTLDSSQKFNDSQRARVTAHRIRPVAIMPLNVPSQFSLNVAPPPGVPNTASQPGCSRRTSQSTRAHLCYRYPRPGCSVPGNSLPMYPYDQDLSTVSPSAGVDNMPTLTDSFNLGESSFSNTGGLVQEWSLESMHQDVDYGSELSMIPPEQRDTYLLGPYNQQLPSSGNFLAIDTDIMIHPQPAARPEQTSHSLAPAGWAPPDSTQVSSVPLHQTAQDYYFMSSPSSNSNDECRRSPLGNLPYPPDGTVWGYSRTTNYVLLDLSIWQDPAFGLWRRTSTGVTDPNDFTLILRADCVDEWSRYVRGYRKWAPTSRPRVPPPTRAVTAPVPVSTRDPVRPSHVPRHNSYNVTATPLSSTAAQDAVNFTARDPGGESNQNTYHHITGTSVSFTGVSPADFLWNDFECPRNIAAGSRVDAPVALPSSADSTGVTMNVLRSYATGFSGNRGAGTTTPYAGGSTSIISSINDMAPAVVGAAGYPSDASPWTDDDYWYPT